MNDSDRHDDAVAAFANIARALTGSLEVAEALDRIAAETRCLAGADDVSIIVRSGDVAEFLAHRSDGRSPVAVGFQVRPSDELVAALAGRDDPLLIENAGSSPLIPSTIGYLLGSRDVILVPLRIEDATIGVLSLTFRELPARWRGERVLLRALAGQVCVAIRNARLLEEARTSTQRLLDAERLSGLGRLMARVAHELDSPLTTIRLISELLELEELPSAAAEHVHTLAREAEFAGDIVSDLLLFARPRAGFDLGPVDLEEVIREGVARQSSRAAAIGARIVLDLPTDLPSVRADRRALRHVAANLLKNALQALEHASDERLVAVRARPGGEDGPGSIVVEVEDTGPGIPPHVAAHMFDPFVTTKRAGEGTGLGLAIVKDIVEAHGGTIEGRSLEGGGASFRFTLPGAAALPTADAASVAPQPRGRAIRAGAGPQHDPVRSATPQRTGSARVPELVGGESALDGLRVLVIDDDAGLQRALRRVLEQMGCRVVSALTGEEGLRQAREAGLDIILCDVRLPGLDGRTLYSRLSADMPDAARGLVFMTGDVLNEETREFLNEIAAPVLVKPFGRDQLLDHIRQHLGLR